MIIVNNLSYSLAQKELYNNISFTLEEDQHCAFLGVSGSGKSTLMKLIIDPEKYMYEYEGEIERSDDLRIGFISQFSAREKAKDLTVIDYIGEQSIALQNKLTSIYTKMGTTTDINTLMQDLEQTTDAFERLGGNDFEANINKALNVAQLAKFKDVAISKLSGGEFKLIQVIKAMLNAPDLVIMDEPDVFLDFENLSALKDLINAHQGTLLVITHNRYLLHHCFNKILHIENKDVQEFNGKYIDYNFSLLESKIEQQELAFDDNEEIIRNDLLIDKFRRIATNSSEAARGKTVKARAKIQERLKARQIKSPFINIEQPNITLKVPEKTEESTALSVTDYQLEFDEVILNGVNFEMKSTDKVVIIGPNGTGKTSLLRDIFKNNVDSIHVDEDIHMAYLSQLQGEMLDESSTVHDALLDHGFDTLDEINACLNDYGLSEDIIDQKIESLSGGEKNLLQLAKISVGQANMLLLDEPSSHLDTYSQVALEKALKEYPGAILMVSHDFYTISNCMDYVLLIEDKTIRRMTMKKFRRMIYKKHFDRDYLELEQQKLALETKIAVSLKNNDFELVKELTEELEALIKQF